MAEKMRKRTVEALLEETDNKGETSPVFSSPKLCKFSSDHTYAAALPDVLDSSLWDSINIILTDERRSPSPQPETTKPVFKEELAEKCEVTCTSSVPPQVFQPQHQPRLTVAKSSAEPPTSAITLSVQQNPLLSSTVTQSSNITSSVQQQQQQPLLSVVLPQTSVIPSSVQQLPLFALVMPENFHCPKILHQSLSETAVPTLDPLLEHAKEPEFVQVKEEPEEASLEVSLDTDVEGKFAFSASEMSSRVIKEEAEIFSSKEEPASIPVDDFSRAVTDDFFEVPVGISHNTMFKNGDNAARSQSCAFEDTSRHASEDEPDVEDGPSHLEADTDGDELEFPHIEVKIESQPSTEAEADQVEQERQVDHQQLRDLLERAAQDEEKTSSFAERQQNTSSFCKMEPEALEDPDPVSSVSLAQYNTMDTVQSTVTDESMDTQLKEDHYPCTKCNFASNTQCHLKQHLLTAHSNQKFFYQCGQCSYFTRQSKSLKKHRKAVHLDEKPFKCEFCSYKTSTKRALQVHHMAIHSGNRPSKCTQCDYTSVNASHLKRHVDTVHSGPYLEQCEHCDFMGERESTTFQNHIVTMHPDQKMYKCTQCDYTTLQSHRLKEHWLAEHFTDKPYKCEQCNYGTAWSHLLKQHMVSKHSSEKPFKCEHCDYVTTMHLYLKRHVSDKHSGEKPRK